MKLKYDINDLAVSNFRTCDSGVKQEFESWVRALTIELDNEQGDGPEGAWEWVLENDRHIEKEGPYGTFIFHERENGRLVATATLTKDDRNVARDHNLSCLGLWGFFNVHWQFRGRGLGTAIARYMDGHVQNYVESTGQKADIYLFTKEPAAIRIYEQLGFAQQNTEIKLDCFPSSQRLFLKRFFP